MNNAIIGWSRTLTSNLSAELGGGGILISPGLTTYAVNAALIMKFLNKDATISYSRSAFPSFVGVPILLIGDVFSFSAVQKIDQQWQLTESANYMQSSGGSGLNTVAFKSYVASVDISYWMTRIWSTGLSYSYNKFNQTFGSTQTEMDRQVISFSVRASWG
jgi:hypothetical protein